MPFQLPVTIETQTIAAHGFTIYYPSVTNLTHPLANDLMNQTINSLVHWIVQEQAKYQTGTPTEMIGHYEIKTNERGVLSLTLSNYTYSSPMAHGFTIVKSLTFDVNTGKEYTLQDLFKSGSDYITVFSDEVAHQIKQRDLPLLYGFQSIEPDQDYYLADKAIVLYFQIYQITPYYVGFSMFPISVYDLQSIVSEQGPLAVLSAVAA
ncbi:MAG: hypothetical protein JWM44_3494 [Bacilli bacterium]|nr:hypothetical protein [Bacilli bacterium]